MHPDVNGFLLVVLLASALLVALTTIWELIQRFIYWLQGY